MILHWLFILTEHGPQPFAIFFANSSCELVRDALTGIEAVCVAQPRGTPL